MTAVATAGPVGPIRVRIAITSPEILAEIRHVFASKNLAVKIVRAPYVEVVVQPAAVTTGTAPTPAGGPGARRLRAAYRLNVVEVDDGPRAARSPRDGSPHPPVALSRRQHEVMALVSRGARNPEIAASLRVSEKTVKNHINRIFRALGASNRVEAVLIWQRHQRDGGGPTPTRNGSPPATNPRRR